jgi:hypothetical protein
VLDLGEAVAEGFGSCLSVVELLGEGHKLCRLERPLRALLVHGALDLRVESVGKLRDELRCVQARVATKGSSGCTESDCRMELGSARVEYFDTIVGGVAAVNVGVPDVLCSDMFVDLVVNALSTLDIGRAVSVAGGLLGCHQLVNNINISDVKKED